MQASNTCHYIAFPVGEGVSHRLTDEVHLRQLRYHLSYKARLLRTSNVYTYIAFPVGEGVSHRLTDEVQLCTYFVTRLSFPSKGKIFAPPMIRE